MAPDTRSTDVLTFLKSADFKNIIKEVIESETRLLREEIASLKSEVVILRESNIELLHVAANVPSWSGIVNKNKDNSNNLSLNKSGKNSNLSSDIKRPSAVPVKNAVSLQVKNFPEPVRTSVIPEKRVGNSVVVRDEQSGDDTSRAKWEVQRSQRRKFQNKDCIHGNLKNSASAFKGVPKLIDFHVFNCAPNTTSEYLKNYLMDNAKIPDLKCEQIVSKYPDRYSSFKVSIPMNFVDNFKNPDIWPEYVSINKFYNRFFRPNASEKS